MNRDLFHSLPLFTLDKFSKTHRLVIVCHRIEMVG